MVLKCWQQLLGHAFHTGAATWCICHATPGPGIDVSNCLLDIGDAIRRGIHVDQKHDSLIAWPQVWCTAAISWIKLDLVCLSLCTAGSAYAVTYHVHACCKQYVEHVFARNVVAWSDLDDEQVSQRHTSKPLSVLPPCSLSANCHT